MNPRRFVATLAERSQHPYLHEFGWRHPVTVAELLRQLSVAVVRLSLPVHEHHDYALTGMRWRYLGAQAPRLLTGPGADYMRRRFDATTPIEIDVAILHALPQPGCARLEVTTRQREVLEQGKRGDQELRWEISFCRDGSFTEKR